MITYQDDGRTVTVKPSALNLPMIEKRIRRLLPSAPSPEARLLVSVIAQHLHENSMVSSKNMDQKRLDAACEKLMDGWPRTRCPQFCDLLGIDGTALVEEFQAVMKRIHSPAG